MQVRNPRRLKKATPARPPPDLQVKKNLRRRKRAIPEHRRIRVKRNLRRRKRAILKPPQTQGQGRNLCLLKKAIPANRHRIQVRKRQHRQKKTDPGETPPPR